MRRTVRLDPEAEIELQEAAAYYAARSKPACRRFLKAALQLAQLIAGAPDRFPRIMAPLIDLPIRRALVPGFPYALVFTTHEDRVQILAVAHLSREPGYWLQRVSPDNG